MAATRVPPQPERLFRGGDSLQASRQPCPWGGWRSSAATTGACLPCHHSTHNGTLLAADAPQSQRPALGIKEVPGVWIEGEVVPQPLRQVRSGPHLRQWISPPPAPRQLPTLSRETAGQQGASLPSQGHLEKLPLPPHGEACWPTKNPFTTDFLMVRWQLSEGLCPISRGALKTCSSRQFPTADPAYRSMPGYPL